MKEVDLLAELEDVLRAMPALDMLGDESPDVLSWLGRALAIISNWSSVRAIGAQAHLNNIRSPMGSRYDEGASGLVVLLNEARADLRMKTLGPSNVAIPNQSPFEYFDEIRKVIEGAKSDIFFVDPYLDAEFVSRYLPHITSGVHIRLLARERIKTLLPAAEMFVAQSKASVEIRSAKGFHDRYVFVDERECYQSGASFKDGAKKAPTAIIQITDAFAAIFATYQSIWSEAEALL